MSNTKNRGIAVIATGEYNQFMPKLIHSAYDFFEAHVYVFTDQPDLYEDYEHVTVVTIPHYGWPIMPLVRFEIFRQNKHIFKESYMFVLDADTEFLRRIDQGVLGHRVGVLHRNIMRYRDEFNYERRKSSTAYVSSREGEKYFACGFCGGSLSEFNKMCAQIADNIRADIENGIRAVWGDESHLNRYFIDNRPSVVLPPSYMCPETNPYFIPYIKHQDKDFKRVNISDVKRHLSVDPNDFKDIWNT